jgi:hypothetical protein
MDASVLVLVSTAITASVASVLVCRWSYGRRLAALRERLDRSEQARQSAHERSSQARQQIAQLSKAIADLQRRHMVTLDSQRKRAELDRNVPSLPESAVLPASGFADTQPL